ncbi:hypothetical protein DFP73DRAFT_39441 [Morchella snyderi]|nr:hypothetical protein DFP73DRAFT_39441 [Morchella snyderi]
MLWICAGSRKAEAETQEKDSQFPSSPHDMRDHARYGYKANYTIIITHSILTGGVKLKDKRSCSPYNGTFICQILRKETSMRLCRIFSCLALTAGALADRSPYPPGSEPISGHQKSPTDNSDDSLSLSLGSSPLVIIEQDEHDDYSEPTKDVYISPKPLLIPQDKLPEPYSDRVEIEIENIEVTKKDGFEGGNIEEVDIEVVDIREDISGFSPEYGMYPPPPPYPHFPHPEYEELNAPPPPFPPYGPPPPEFYGLPPPPDFYEEQPYSIGPPPIPMMMSPPLPQIPSKKAEKSKGGNVYDKNSNVGNNVKEASAINKAKGNNFAIPGQSTAALDNSNLNQDFAVAKSVEKNINIDVNAAEGSTESPQTQVQTQFPGGAVGPLQQGQTFLPGGVMPIGMTDIVFPDIIITNANDINNANENQNQVAANNENANNNPNALGNENSAASFQEFSEQNYAENNFHFNEEKNFFYINAIGPRGYNTLCDLPSSDRIYSLYSGRFI